MSSRSTSLEPKSQLTINLDPGWECSSSPSEENKKKRKRSSRSKIGRKQKTKKVPDQRSEERKRRKFPIKDWKKAKKKEKFLIKDRKKTKEICRKVFGPDNIWTIQNCHKKTRKERKSRLEVVLSFWLPTKILCNVTFSPCTKQKQKRKRPKHLEPNFPPRTVFPKKSYWSMITHVIFDLIGNDLQNQVMTYLWFGIRMKHLSVWGLYTLSDFL